MRHHRRFQKLFKHLMPFWTEMAIHVPIDLDAPPVCGPERCECVNGLEAFPAHRPEQHPVRLVQVDSSRIYL